MQKLDLAKADKTYYTARTKPELVDIKKTQFISLTGNGDPAHPAFADRIQALYATAYSIKFSFKERGNDFVVPKLEGLWWYNEQKYAGFSMSETAARVPRAEWFYRLLIRMPDFVKKENIEEAVKNVLEKKEIVLAEKVEMFALHEGKSIQILHVGPFDKEPETLKKIFEFSEKHELSKNGLHHEIYLSDFRKTPPEKLKTILREPVK